MKSFEDCGITDEQIANNYGFVYYITLPDGGFYIGKKAFNSRPDWKNYKTSSKEVKEIIKQHGADFQILELAVSKRHLTYLETYFQFFFKCLEDDNCYNKSILGRFYKGKLK